MQCPSATAETERDGKTADFATLETDNIEVDEGEKVDQDLLQALTRELKHWTEGQGLVGDPNGEGEDSHNGSGKMLSDKTR